MTVCAGRLTPHENVAMQTITCTECAHKMILESCTIFAAHARVMDSDDLLLHHLGVACELANLDTEDGEPPVEVSDHLLYEYFHESDVDYLKGIESKLPSLLTSRYLAS